MSKTNLNEMSVGELVALANEIQEVLAAKIKDATVRLQKGLDAILMFERATATSNGDGRRATGRKPTAPTAKPRKPASKKRRKVAPKFRGPNGETWAGRGLAPKWLAELEAKGKKREQFLIKS